MARVLMHQTITQSEQQPYRLWRTNVNAITLAVIGLLRARRTIRAI